MLYDAGKRFFLVSTEKNILLREIKVKHKIKFLFD